VVVAINAQIDAKTFAFSAPVTIRLDARRLGMQVKDLAPGADFDALRIEALDSLVGHGVRAQLQSGDLLTGAMFVAFDFFPDAPPARSDWAQTPPQLPTMPGDLQAIEASATALMKKLGESPFKNIGDDLRKAIVELDRTLVTARGTLDKADRLVDNADAFVGNADKMVQPDSVLGAELGNTLQEVSRAAPGLRVLADYLERHPESLLRGKPGDAEEER